VMPFDTYVEAAERASRQNLLIGGAWTREHPLLNGAPYKAFRQSIDLADRRDAGTFFSGPAIATRLADLIASEVPEHALVVDPTCGLGDLLLAYAEQLPVAGSLSETLAVWGERLGGLDLREDLVRMTKVRLVMLARVRGGFGGLVDELGDIFPLIAVFCSIPRLARPYRRPSLPGPADRSTQQRSFSTLCSTGTIVFGPSPLSCRKS
jgi:hypothetical protein